jgi:hypothetical protein
VWDSVLRCRFSSKSIKFRHFEDGPMKRAQPTELQIIVMLEEYEAGAKATA